MNTTRKLSLNILGVFAMGLLSQGCDSSDSKGQTPAAAAAPATPAKAAPRAVNIKHRAKNPSACEAAIQVCVDQYEVCTPDGSDPNSCPHELHECILETLGSDACLPDCDDKKKKKKKKKKDCDKGEDDKKKDDCEKDFEDGDPDFEDGDPNFEDEDPDFEEGESGFEEGDPEGGPEGGEGDFELGDEDDIPDFEECEDLNFFAQIAKNLGLNLKVASCKK